MSRIQLSPATADDVRDIREWTRENLGLPQSARVTRHLLAALEALADTPLSGRRKKECDPPGRSFRYRVVMSRFLVVYEPAGGEIRVARILHGARDVSAELERDPGAED